MTLPTRPYSAFLFDMDGTLLTSIASAERAWTQWALGHGLDPADLIAVMHGVRAVETVRRFAPPGADIEAETRAITEAEIADTSDVREIAGAAAFLASLPEGRWALVTSASRLVFEDTHAGITAAQAAGADVVVITATHKTPLDVAHPGLAHYADVRIKHEAEGRFRLVTASN